MRFMGSDFHCPAKEQARTTASGSERVEKASGLPPKLSEDRDLALNKVHIPAP